MTSSSEGMTTTFVKPRLNCGKIKLKFSQATVPVSELPAVVLILETSEMSAILVFTTKTTQPRSQVLSVNGTLTFRGLHF